MGILKHCKHCHVEFRARRRNQIYCCQSCKTLASYKRNGYKYVSGHYQKSPDQNKEQKTGLAIPQNQMEEKLNEVVEKLNKINVAAIANSAVGHLAAEAAQYGTKKLLAPHTLPATKQDIAQLNWAIFELKQMLQQINDNQQSSFNFI
ncbi:hypothetical protein [Mangrovimonas xylaniphaga]|uniref:hypothetical protein n=1 Tax=Mangrovimonas xylaniphaga TaxID=1645915 RepID=UPI0006B5A126|nr:hypothetical protein [Mangrovimonas xylaniphaga]